MARDDSDSDASRSESELSGEESDDEFDDEEEEDDEELEGTEAKHKLVEADLAAIKTMMEEMDKIKMRLQFRLAREQAISSESGSSRRRSSIDEIFVPPKVATAVQTTWDMPRMFEVEKVISSSANNTPPIAPVPETRNVEVPIKPSVQLSLEDLAKSYGVEDAVFGNDTPSKSMSSIVQSPTAMEGYLHQSAPPQSTKPKSSMWDGLVMGGAGSSSLGNDSITSIDKPPKLHQSQLMAASDHSARSPSPVDLHDSFGTPVSPTHTQASLYEDERKTMEEKEMEAIKGLLFF